jgi:hypothetical protein
MRKIQELIRKIIGTDYTDNKLNWYRFEKNCMASDGWTRMHFSKMYKKRKSENIKNFFNLKLK